MKNLFALLFLLSASAFGVVPQTRTIEQNPGALMYRNFVVNPGAELNVTSGITNASAIVTRIVPTLPATAIEGIAHFGIDATATTQNVDWATKVFDLGLKNNQCEAQWRIQGDASLYTANVLINSIVTSSQVLSNFPDPTLVSIPFACGDLSQATSLRIASTGNGAPILVDSVYVGRATSTASQIAQATLVGTVTITGCSARWTTSSSTFAGFGTNTSCVYTTTGSLQAPGTQLAGFVIPTGAPGEYRFEYEGYLLQGTTSGETFYQFYDGTNVTREQSVLYNTGGGLGLPNINGTISYPQGFSNLNVQVRAKTNTGSATLAGTTAYPGVFRVYRYPTQSQVIAPDQANYGPVDYTPTLSAGFGTPTNVKFQQSRVGGNLVVRGTMTTGTVSAITANFSLPPGLSIDTTRTSIQNNTANAGPVIGTWSQNGAANNVGNMVSATASSLTDVYIGGQYATNSMNAPANVQAVISSNQSLSINFSVPIAGWNSTSATLIPGSVSSNSVGQERIERAKLSCTSSSSIVSQSGSWVSSIGNLSSGACAVTLVTGTFSATPTCVVVGQNSNAYNGLWASNEASSTSITFNCFNTGGAASCSGVGDTIRVLCMGPR